MNSSDVRVRSWPYLRTPIGVFVLVMGPVCGLMAFLLFANTPAWMRATAAGVIALTLIFAYRGYARRLRIDAAGASFGGWFGRTHLSWESIRHVGSYIPGGGAGATAYVYLTRRDDLPIGAWDNDSETLQIQDRPGLLVDINSTRDTAQTKSRRAD